MLCNGPGTCVPICISALLLGILGIKKVIIVYVESICRVEHLSLSGKILFHLSDYFIVQWPTLKEKYPKSVYLGRIVWPTTYFLRILLATVFTVNGEQKNYMFFIKKLLKILRIIGGQEWRNVSVTQWGNWGSSYKTNINKLLSMYVSVLQISFLCKVFITACKLSRDLLVKQ